MNSLPCVASRSPEKKSMRLKNGWAGQDGRYSGRTERDKVTLHSTEGSAPDTENRAFESALPHPSPACPCPTSPLLAPAPPLPCLPLPHLSPACPCPTSPRLAPAPPLPCLPLPHLSPACPCPISTLLAPVPPLPCLTLPATLYYGLYHPTPPSPGLPLDPLPHPHLSCLTHVLL
ncbi:hypothetical protein Pcinc_042683 [Petrolisthes cinctipes]|uniref:Uncharacterized protein n=1 Tax=Petrolisthes cinctipes TaxID=88211 RepID=A0AAE1BK56_PETCI|nr:hypothetical protein Pcinc_042683 [Petrolisthes cinctipes]